MKDVLDIKEIEMHECPTISIKAGAVTSTVSGKLSPVPIKATPAQLAFFASGCGMVIDRLGEVRQFVDVMKIRYIFVPGERFGPEAKCFFVASAIINNGVDKSEASPVRIDVEGDALQGTVEEFAQQLYDTIVAGMKSWITDAHANMRYWEDTLEPLA